MPAVLGVQAHSHLENNINSQRAADQGVTVLVILLAGIAGALLAYAALRGWSAAGDG